MIDDVTNEMSDEIAFNEKIAFDIKTAFDVNDKTNNLSFFA